MAIPSRQIGWSTTDNLLWEISKQMEQLTCTVACGPQTAEVASQKAYGSFISTEIQTATSGVAKAMYYEETQFSRDVVIENDLDGKPSIITVTKEGIYNVQFSAQFKRLSGGSAAEVDIWLRMGGVNVPNSNTKVTLQSNNAYIVAAWNFFVPMTLSDSLQLMWSQNDAIQMQVDLPNGIHPGIPSVILTVNQVN